MPLSNTWILEKPCAQSGLGTSSISITTTGQYRVHVELTEAPPTGLVLQIFNGINLLYQSPTFGPNETGFQVTLPLNAVSSDTISVVLSSSAANDQQLNTVKSVIILGSGY